MTKSMFDQLKKVGLVDKSKAHKARTDKKQQSKQQRQLKKGKLDESAKSDYAQQALQEKQQRDRKLNAQRKAEADQKALQAQIKQLIKTHRQDKGVDADAQVVAKIYNFIVENKVKQLHVSEKIHQQLLRGQLAVVPCDETYELLPLVVVEKILSRAPDYPVIRNEKVVEENADDPYKDYVVPDDLIW